MSAAELPDGVDPELWFECCHHPCKRDYLAYEPWQTFPGRMAAWCEEGQVGFRVSKAGLPPNLPTATDYYVRGFLVGNVPPHPDNDDWESEEIVQWRAKATHFLETGFWEDPPTSHPASDQLADE